MTTLRRKLLSTPARRALAIVALIAVAATLSLRAQDKPPAEKPVASQVGGLHFVDVSEITVVNVDVAISDRNGPIQGLTKDDFEVYQDGKLQEISNFAVYSEEGPPLPVAAPAAAAPQPTATPIPAPEPALKREPLFIALYIDNENVAPLNRNRVLNRVTDFVMDRVKAPDQGMLLSYQRSLKVLQPFTTDPEEILGALRKVKLYAGGRVTTNSDRKDIESAINDEGTGSNGGRGDTDRLLGLIRSFAQEQQTNLKFTVGALKEAMTMMSGLPGRKVLVYVSDGLPMNPGMELYYAMQEQFNDPSMLAQSQDMQSTELFRGLVTTAAAAGVVIYAIDCRGLDAELGNEAEYRTSRSTMAASVGRQNYQDSLIYMAEQTGGRALINTNDPTDGLKLISKELATYYSLGYRLTPSGQDRLHRVQVKIKANKGSKNYRLSYRKTFIEKSLPTRIGDRVISGLTLDIDDNPLEITLTTGEPTPSSGGRWLLPVEVRVPIGKVAFVPDGEDLSGYVSVYYAARDNDGKQSDLQRVDQAIKVPAAEYEAAKAKYYVVGASLLLEPGTYRISVGLRDQLTNQAGYATVRRPVHPEKS